MHTKKIETITNKNLKKVILITGGSQGLGRSIAENFNKGHHVVVISNDMRSLEDTIKTLKCPGYFCDITNAEQVEYTINDIIKVFRRIDILINNAGVWVGGDLEENSYNDIARVMGVNTIGTMFMTKAVLPYMKKQRFGKILNINSVNGIDIKKDRSVYIASKWALTGFSKALREDLREFDIQVMDLHPSLIKTTLFKNANGKRDMSSAMDVMEVVKTIGFMLSFDGSVVPESLVLKDMYYE